jgi:hypothetical protein
MLATLSYAVEQQLSMTRLLLACWWLAAALSAAIAVAYGFRMPRQHLARSWTQ